MAGTVFSEHMNEHVLLKLLSDLHSTLDDRAVWGSHLGSETLMRGHKNSRSRIACIAALEKRKVELEQRKKLEQGEEEDTMNMEGLPEECVREILCRLSDYKDVDNAGEDKCDHITLIARGRLHEHKEWCLEQTGADRRQAVLLL